MTESFSHLKKIVAPMVDQSELAWRILSRRYGAQLCYTPMFHARLFATDKKYRQDMFGPLDGNPETDRPLVVQFCANDPQYLVQAAKLVQDRCDAVDLNLGCPQGIAKKGKYGAWLMEDWDLIESLIKNLSENLDIPVTAKIRVFPKDSKSISNGAQDEDFDKEKTLNYARMILNAGAQLLTVHGRTRDMKGQLTGIANWNIIKYLYDNLSKEYSDINKKLVLYSNGNILYPEDIQRCLDYIGCQGVMSAEANLYNPGVFSTDIEGLSSNEIMELQHPRVDKLAREYFDIVMSVCEQSEASKHAIKSHLFKLLHSFLPLHTDLRMKIAKNSVKKDIKTWEPIIKEIESIVGEVYDAEKDVVVEGEKEWWGGSYKSVPYWRCQPYFRKVDGKLVTEDIKRKRTTVMDSSGAQNSERKKSKVEVVAN